MKQWHQSRTIWFNIGSGLVAIGNELAPVVLALDGDVQQTARVAVAVAISLGNIILRLITDKGIGNA